MTYRDLLLQLQHLKPEQLDMDLTVFVPVEDEYYRGSFLIYHENDDGVLDPGHPFIKANQ